MPDTVDRVIKEFADGVKMIVGENLVKVILYGSYARNEQRENSDIDIMILVTFPEEKIKTIENEIYDLAFDIEMSTGKDITPIIKNQDQYNYWKEALPFYRNIQNEGVVVA